MMVRNSTVLFEDESMLNPFTLFISVHNQTVIMLQEIMVTQYGNRALCYLHVVPIFQVGGSTNISLSVIGCHHFHEKCLFTSFLTPAFCTVSVLNVIMIL
jgi:hypothetical protein